jgi:hypothetical protein
MSREQFDQRVFNATDEQIAAAVLAIGKKPGMFDDLIPPPTPWASVGKAASIAFGIPLVVLILGASLVWAFAGFSAKRP